MQKRIEQLLKEGFSQTDAEAIVAAEAKRAEELIAEGFNEEKAGPRAIREVKFARLVKEKVFAGLSRAQAEGVATEQVNHDERLAAEAAKATAAKTEEAAK
jgi:hypothetical protein